MELLDKSTTISNTDDTTFRATRFARPMHSGYEEGDGEGSEGGEVEEEEG